jgi:predicted transcriptional regulator
VTASIEVGNAGNPTVQVVAMTAVEARQVTDELRSTLRLAHGLLIRAYQGRAWSVLGYSTWDDYCQTEFAEARMVRLDRDQRREIATEMRSAGMSQRAIASGLGVPKSTVGDDLAGNEQVPGSGQVTGRDGKVYPAAAATNESVDRFADYLVGEDEDFEAAISQARAEQDLSRENVVRLMRDSATQRLGNTELLAEMFETALADLRKAAERVHRLHREDRFRAERADLRVQFMPDLIRSSAIVQEVIEAMRRPAR